MKLWEHQNEAINKCRDYIDSFKKTDETIALIQLPTGTGKSGVITVLSMCYEYDGIVLIITPRRYLRRQLAEDIMGRFFNTIDYSNKGHNEVIEIKESNQFTDNVDLNNKVIVMTFQMLSYLEKKKFKIFSDLCHKTSLVMIDEGHYEPAHNWNNLVKSIKAPKILFTATPYRNDAKSFAINPQYTFGVSLIECQNQNLLKKEIIEIRNNQLLSSYEGFIDDVISFYKEKLLCKNPEARVIIQCGNSGDIHRIVDLIINRGYSAIGIHEKFDRNSEYVMKNVPNPKVINVSFWVHQYKLIEGVDDPRFQLLALHSPSSNARSLVQGIGRIMRNPNKDKNAMAYVLDYHNGYHKELWDSYKHFDKLTKKVEDLNDFIKGNDVKSLIKNQPPVSYIDGKFRKQFNLYSIDAEKDIQIPLKTQILKRTREFDFDGYIESYEEFLSNKDYIIKSQIIDENCVVILCISGRNNVFLINHVFIEPKLDVVVIMQTSNYVFLYTSIKTICFGKETLVYVEKISKKKLTTLFSNSKKTSITDVKLKNTNIGKNVIRNKKINAISIENTVPSFDDFEHVCTMIEGYTIDEASQLVSDRKVSKRYLGILNGTIIQQTSKYQKISIYCKWIKLISEIVDSDVDCSLIFNRYALETNQPLDTTPLSILFDVDEIEGHYVHFQKQTEHPIFNEALCVINQNECTCIINKKLYNIKINFNKNVYTLSCRELEKDYIPNNSEVTSSIISYINKNQCFSIVPKSSDCIYVNGEFYNPKFKYGENFDLLDYDLKHCFITDDLIGSREYEKGTDAYYVKDSIMDNWDPQSIFGDIANLGKGTSIEPLLKNIDIIICDDGGAESADFILCDTKANKVIFVHAKAKKISNKRQKNFCSASGLHEVCSQAVKNLIFISPFNDIKPSKFNSWDGGWTGKVSSTKNKKDVQGHVKRRISCLYRWEKERIWNEIRGCLKHPNSEKEVWIVLGNILSKNTFENKMKKKLPDPVVLHTAYILNSTLTSIATTGAKLKIVCRT